MFAIKINSTPRFSRGGSDVSFKYIANCLSDVSGLYPNFKNWLYMTFRPGHLNGSRTVLFSYVGDKVSGISMLKHDLLERKICTFYVLPEFRGRGLGAELMNRSVDILGGKDIVITVSEERTADLYPTLMNSGFIFNGSSDGMYRSGKFENIYLL